MIDLRPVLYVIGLLVTILGAAMTIPLAVDIAVGNGAWQTFATASIVTTLIGGLCALGCANARKSGLTLQQTFLLTTGVWVALPIFGAIPFCLGERPLPYGDAFFEAMSGLTTTGSTVYSGLGELTEGKLLWRGLMQWFGGIGIIVVAMVFLPTLRVGGMQIFRSEGFDTFGKILPRAAEIAGSIAYIYVGLTLICMFAYSFAGLAPFDAVVHAMTTIATGGFSNHDASFAALPAASEYVGAVFMMLASLPFVRYVQLTAGTARPLFEDSQIRLFLVVALTVVAALAAWQALVSGAAFEPAFRKALFNGVSILTGTGYASANYGGWGALPVVLFFLIGLVGGCAGSTTCSIKIFRFQILAAAIATQVRRIHVPSGVFTPRYEGRPVSEDVMSSVMAFFVLFALSLAVLSIALGMMGLSTITALSGAATALANVGPGLGPEIGPTGNFSSLPDSAKWLLAAAMLIGRLELMSVYVLFTVAFWRR
ncbi:MAG: TrkH family potassium uptake protein [Pseudomonadota bacterium]